MTTAEAKAFIKNMKKMGIEAGHTLSEETLKALISKTQGDVALSESHRYEKALHNVAGYISGDSEQSFEAQLDIIYAAYRQNPRTELHEIDGVDWWGDVDDYMRVEDLICELEY